jgi:thiol-disulfide isomerase/thioredoxin
MNAILMLLLAADLNGQATPDIVLLDFTAQYCQPCQQMVPMLQRMEKDGFPVEKIDITERPDLSRQYKVERIPTLILLVEGKVVKRYEGLTAEEELRRQMLTARDRLVEARKKVALFADPEPSAPTVPVNSAGNQLADKNESRSLGDVFRGMFGKDGSAGGGSVAAVRAQNVENPVAGEAIRKAAAATVRVRVTGSKLQDVGTGTIVYSTVGESLVLTCAHLFDVGKESSPKVEVDVFLNGKVAKFPATVIGGSHDSDLAFLKLQNSTLLPFVPLFNEASQVSAGQPVVSYGCNNGDVPSVLTANVLKINPYQGPANLTCSKDPVQGRSGGGLFSLTGELLAVCSGAFRKEQEGLYMSQPAINALVKKLHLEHALTARPESSGEDASLVFAEGENSKPADPSVNSPALKDPEFAAVTKESDFPETPEFTVVEPEANVLTELADTSPSGTHQEPEAVPAMGSGKALAMPASLNSGDRGDSGTEITVLINSREPGGPKRMIVIPRATPWLIELLTGEAVNQQPSGKEAAVPTSLGKN